MLLGPCSEQAQHLALSHLGQAADAVVLGDRVLLALGVHVEKTRKAHDLAAGAQTYATRRDVDGGLSENGRGHLTSQKPIPDERVELDQIVDLAGVATGAVVRKQGAHALGLMVEQRGPDGLVRVLSALLRLVDVRLGGQVGRGETAADEVTHGEHGIVRDARGVRAHVRDEAGRSLVPQLEALVEPLGQGHGSLGGEAQLARRLLLQARGDEGWWRVLAAFLALHRRHLQWRLPNQLDDLLRLPLVRQRRLVTVQPTHARSEGRGPFALDIELDGPVLLATEGFDLFLALDEQAHRHRLHPTRGKPTPHLGPQDRADLVAH